MNIQIKYNLSSIPGFTNFIQTGNIEPEYEKYFSQKQYNTKANEKYTIIKYSKDFLRSDLISSFGLLRSVIFSGTKMVCFAPPKALSAESFMTEYSEITDDIIAEDFIEGTMINVFYDYNYGVNGCWQIATRNTVGAEVSFYKWSKLTFNQMFIEACIANNFNIQTLNPKFCYSFILQHPSNRIVIPFSKPQLYLVAVYEIIQKNNEFTILEENLTDVKQCGEWNTTGIKFPEKYKFSSYTELIEKYASGNTPYDILGIVIKNIKTGERSKFRNPIYEEVKNLRGNQPKLQYQYLCLRHSGKLPDFLKYYPETKEEMSKYRDQVHMFTENLHKNYFSCYVKKEKPLNEYPDQYKTHMFKLHEHFISNLRPKNLYVTNTEVIKYVNKLPPTLLMYCLNLNMRKRSIDTIKADKKI